MRRRRLLAMLGAIALTVSLAAATDAASARDVNRLRVAGATSTFGLVTASSSAELAVYTEEGEDWAFMELDLGVHAAAGKEPFEIRAVRTSYDKPIEATRVTPSGTPRCPPAVDDLSGLTDFATVTLKDSRGRTALSHSIDFCPNGYAQRISKDAPVDSRYPHECAFNPYALGGVWGIQRGYAVPLLGEDGYIDGDAKDMPKPGRYRAEVKVNKAYARRAGHPAGVDHGQAEGQGGQGRRGRRRGGVPRQPCLGDNAPGGVAARQGECHPRRRPEARSALAARVGDRR